MDQAQLRLEALRLVCEQRLPVDTVETAERYFRFIVNADQAPAETPPQRR